MNRHPHQALSAYADGELPAEEARRVEAHVRQCTECARELALIRNLGGVMRSMPAPSRRSDAWEGVNRRIARPAGWLLLIIGVILWAGLALVGWFRQTLTLEWVAATAVAAGLAVLAASIAYEQYRDWTDSPYKDVER
jgi:anti-sigma factor RsiW